MLLSLTDPLNNFKFRINSKKTKTLMVENNDIRSNIDIKIGNIKFELVKKFFNLRSITTETNCCMAEIKSIIALGKKTNNVLTNKHKSIEAKKKKSLSKTLIWSVILYGCESFIRILCKKRQIT